MAITLLQCGLRVLKSKLKPQGRLLITVPAFESLWSSEDDAAGHFRRYTKKTLQSVCRKAGFKILYLNYFFEFLYLPIFFVRHLFEKIGIIKKKSERNAQEQEQIALQQFKERKGLINSVLSFFERRELKKLTKNKKILFGSSLICVLEVKN